MTVATFTELTPVERAALVGYVLAAGVPLTSNKVAEMTGCQQWTARRLLNNLCRVLPLAEDRGEFVVINTREG